MTLILALNIIFYSHDQYNQKIVMVVTNLKSIRDSDLSPIDPLIISIQTDKTYFKLSTDTFQTQTE